MTANDDIQPGTPGRPRIGNEVLVRLGDLLSLVDGYATDQHITRAEAIRQLIGDGLEAPRTRAGEWLGPKELADAIRLAWGGTFPDDLSRRISAAADEGSLTCERVASQSLRWNGHDDARFDLIERLVELPTEDGKYMEYLNIYEVAHQLFYREDYQGRGSERAAGWRRFFADRAEAERHYADAVEDQSPSHPFRPAR